MSERRKILECFEQQKAVWEPRAAEGIERYRKGDARIRVVDEQGKGVENAEIRAVQKSHAFRFGANLFLLDELETPEKNERYKALFSGLFNMATLPFYWSATEPREGQTRYGKESEKIYRRPPIDLCMEFCREKGIEPREHALAYEAFFPDWLCGAPEERVRAAYERRCREIAERYAGEIRTIEVTNEMEWKAGKTSFYDAPDFVAWCFKTAEKYFPANQLVINEHTRLAWEDRCRPTDKYYAYTEANLLKGARIDGIGMQYHLFNRREAEYEMTRLTLNPESLYRHLDLYSQFGKPIQITEVTVPSYSWEPKDEEIQAEIVEKLYSIWFSHPQVEQIIYWNLVDGYAHVSEKDSVSGVKNTQGNMSIGENYYHGGLLRFDMTPKPAYRKIQELTQKVWHTDQTCVTDGRGEASFRGFYGDYELEVCTGGKRTLHRFTLSAENNGETAVLLKA